MSVEHTVGFGDGFSLNGIVCHGDDENGSGPALIILNSGMMHRVGTCRTSVVLARTAADLGMLSLRFDHSGIGDSSPRQTPASDEERMLEEIKAAQDFIQARYGISQFVLYGLCSGAQYSFKHALLDNKVVGLVGIDHYVYSTTQFYLRHYGARSFSLGAWMRLFSGVKDSLSAKIGMTGSLNADEGDVWFWPPRPPRDTLEQGYRKLIEKGVRLYYIYTGSGSGYNYREQMIDMYPNVNFGDLLTIDYFPTATHIMKEPSTQKEINQNVIRWLQEFH
jgi:hypothetical protein